jgi:hypothetical protein
MRQGHKEVMRISPEEAKIIEFMSNSRSNHELYMSKCLKVVAKTSDLVPLDLNFAQDIIHAKIQSQLNDHRLVRALILKARKQGASTYIGGRFYTKTRLWKYRRAVVMAHVNNSSKDLFTMVQNFYANDPMRLQHEKASAQEYKFSNGSSYAVATAGSGETGRGATPTLAHLSEAAFYPNPEKTFAGFVNSIPMADNTEVCVESTANGIGNEFHQRWTRAEAGMADESAGISFIPIFIPWYVSPEYRLRAPSGFQLRGEPEGDGLPSERDIADMYSLDMEQMVWRRFYVEQQLNGNIQTFMQEFPSTPSEAFQTTGLDLFIKPVYVQRARNRKGIQAHGPKILGVDPAGLGGDKFMISLRQGHVLHWQVGRAGVEPGEEQVEWVANIMQTENVDRCNIDYSGGWGTSLLAGMKERYPKLADKCYPIDFGSKSQQKQVNPHKPGPRNRRAEMYQRARSWLELPEGVSIPDDNELQSDLGAIAARISGQTTDLVLESKVDIKNRLGRSPDAADSFVLTFAVPDRVIQHDLTPSAATSTDKFNHGAPDQSTPSEFTPGPPTQFDSGGGWML